MSEIRGYKVFNSDWTCMGFQFEVGGTYEEDVTPKCCNRGFHFCLKAADCFNYYGLDPNSKVAKVVALGEVDERSDDSKCCTNKIQIVREIPWQELLEIVNMGKGCTGLRNTGHRNTGDWNTGNWNTGHRNTGHCNTGNRNIGDWNTGDCNTGNRNTGHRNTGDCNTGSRNTGDWNTGNWNTGHRNTGHRNTGDWNITNFSSGCFNKKEQKIVLFDKPSDWTYRDWLNSEARCLLSQIPKKVVEWTCDSGMTEKEKVENPTYETTGGYLKVLDESECAQMWWDGLSERNRGVIREVPNFDAGIFEECTGIKIAEVE